MSKLEFRDLKLERDEVDLLLPTDDCKNLTNSIFANVVMDHRVFIMSPEAILPADVRENLAEGYDIDYDNVRLPEVGIDKKNEKYSVGYFFQSVFAGKFYVNALQECKSKKVDTQYYVAVEEDEENCHMVRGVVRIGQDGKMSASINPEHEKRMDMYRNVTFTSIIKNILSDEEDIFSLRRCQDRINDFMAKEYSLDTVR